MELKGMTWIYPLWLIGENPLHGVESLEEKIEQYRREAGIHYMELKEPLGPPGPPHNVYMGESITWS
jgi:hypothetical protein